MSGIPLVSLYSDAGQIENKGLAHTVVDPTAVKAVIVLPCGTTSMTTAGQTAQKYQVKLILDICGEQEVIFWKGLSYDDASKRAFSFKRIVNEALKGYDAWARGSRD